MAYNSDGYIMFDFSDVDFRRASQTIEGLYDRCVKIIGTNKFILVINANGKTPLPSVCSFINNQYVIESCLYTFAITSNDTILIRRNEPDPSQLINDEITSPLFTWSSSKIDSELDTKADASSLADYQPLLIPVSPISIDSSNNIGVDLSSYQPLLTEGDNISIVNNVISAKGIKSFTFVGDGLLIKTIKFPTIPTLVLSIDGLGTVAPNAQVCLACPIHHNSYFLPILYRRASSQGQSVGNMSKISFFVGDTLQIETNTNYPEFIFNTEDTIYTVYYI